MHLNLQTNINEERSNSEDDVNINMTGSGLMPDFKLGGNDDHDNDNDNDNDNDDDSCKSSDENVDHPQVMIPSSKAGSGLLAMDWNMIGGGRDDSPYDSHRRDYQELKPRKLQVSSKNEREAAMYKSLPPLHGSGDQELQRSVSLMNLRRPTTRSPFAVPSILERSGNNGSVNIFSSTKDDTFAPDMEVVHQQLLESESPVESNSNKSSKDASSQFRGQVEKPKVSSAFEFEPVWQKGQSLPYPSKVHLGEREMRAMCVCVCSYYISYKHIHVCICVYIHYFFYFFANNICCLGWGGIEKQKRGRECKNYWIISFIVYDPLHRNTYPNSPNSKDLGTSNEGLSWNNINPSNSSGDPFYLDPKMEEIDRSDGSDIDEDVHGDNAKERPSHANRYSHRQHFKEGRDFRIHPIVSRMTDKKTHVDIRKYFMEYLEQLISIQCDRTVSDIKRRESTDFIYDIDTPNGVFVYKNELRKQLEKSWLARKREMDKQKEMLQNPFNSPDLLVDESDNENDNENERKVKTDRPVDHDQNITGSDITLQIQKDNGVKQMTQGNTKRYEEDEKPIYSETLGSENNNEKKQKPTTMSIDFFQPE
ncbi:hypothetical protein RFI_14805 [Reticulomyxa filosa]|uniref:Uncharacterized protein n=1 Tax=Reticulomyxa filosa TaxID=46433 RepID=X6N9J5_RETFI|nr:hypothetical protein RFI_14805 [Reticulomyxa filosa]|eukprot:ETO22394.1 hypothetical protein RFI_14805 [Reticulomyxa filosa]